MTREGNASMIRSMGVIAGTRASGGGRCPAPSTITSFLGSRRRFVQLRIMYAIRSYYDAALKLRKVPTALVRVPDASHGIANKPSNLIAKVAYVLGWFERYGGDRAATQAGGH